MRALSQPGVGREDDRMRLRRLLALAVVAGSLAGFAAPSAGAAPAAQPVPSIPTVGALFIPSVAGLGPALGLPHYCSASVVHSAGHNLVLTAAHCIYGTGFAIEFAPGYADGRTPYGVWAIRHVYLEPAWRQGQDPRADVAVLQMAPRGGRNVEEVTGAAPVLGTAPVAGSPVTVDGYVAGVRGRPITCTAPVYYTAGFPSFDCDGYANGVSGGPWLQDGRVVGVIGGLHQGGCTPSTSYSAPFGGAVAALVSRAEAGGRGDVAPFPGSDGC